MRAPFRSPAAFPNHTLHFEPSGDFAGLSAALGLPLSGAFGERLTQFIRLEREHFCQILVDILLILQLLGLSAEGPRSKYDRKGRADKQPPRWGVTPIRERHVR